MIASGKKTSAPRTVTVVTQIRPEAMDELNALLSEFGSRVREDCGGLFDELTAVHFARWFVIEEMHDPDRGRNYPPTLVYSCVTDLDVTGHLDELVQLGGETVTSIYACCEQFPAGAAPHRVTGYLRSHYLMPCASFRAQRGHSLAKLE